MKLFVLAVSGLFGLLLAACAANLASKGKHDPAPRKVALPPLPWDHVQSKRSVPSLAVVPKTFDGRVTLHWSNQDEPASSNYATGILRSADLIHWQEVAVVPYQPAGTFELSNRPPTEFYRLYNTIKSP